MKPLRLLATDKDARGFSLSTEKELLLQSVVSTSDPWVSLSEQRSDVSKLITDLDLLSDSLELQRAVFLHESCQQLLHGPTDRLEMNTNGCDVHTKRRLGNLLHSHQSNPNDPLRWELLTGCDDWRFVAHYLPRGQNNTITSAKKEPILQGVRPALEAFLQSNRKAKNDALTRHYLQMAVFQNAPRRREGFTLNSFKQEYKDRFAGHTGWSIVYLSGGASFYTALRKFCKQNTKNRRTYEKMFYSVMPKRVGRYGCPKHPQAVFDSQHERAIGLLLHEIGVLPNLREGEAVHVPTLHNDPSSVDFRMYDAEQNNIWVEFHPPHAVDVSGGVDEIRRRKGPGIKQSETFVLMKDLREVFDAIKSEPLKGLVNEEFQDLTHDQFLVKLNHWYRQGYSYDTRVDTRIYQTTLFDKGSDDDSESAKTKSVTKNPTRGKAPDNLRTLIHTDGGKMNEAGREFFINHPYMNEHLCRKWGIGFVPKGVTTPWKDSIAYSLIVRENKHRFYDLQQWIRRNMEYDQCLQSFNMNSDAGLPVEFFYPTRAFKIKNHLYGEHLLSDPQTLEAMKIHGLTLVPHIHDVLVLDRFGIPALATFGNVISDEQASQLSSFVKHPIDGDFEDAEGFDDIKINIFSGDSPFVKDSGTKLSGGLAHLAKANVRLNFIEHPESWSASSFRSAAELEPYFPNIDLSIESIPETHPDAGKGILWPEDSDHVPF